MTNRVAWERGDRCRDCGIRPDEALGLAFCQCPDKQPLDELAERAVAEGRRLEREAIVAAVNARCDRLAREGDRSDREGAEWGRAILEDALAILDWEHEKGGDK